MVGSGLPLPSRIGSSPQRMLVENASNRWGKWADLIAKFFFLLPVAICSRGRGQIPRWRVAQVRTEQLGRTAIGMLCFCKWWTSLTTPGSGWTVRNSASTFLSMTTSKSSTEYGIPVASIRRAADSCAGRPMSCDLSCRVATEKLFSMVGKRPVSKGPRAYLPAECLAKGREDLVRRDGVQSLAVDHQAVLRTFIRDAVSRKVIAAAEERNSPCRTRLR